MRTVVADEVARIEAAGEVDRDRLAHARELFERFALAREYVEFLTVPAYELLG